ALGVEVTAALAAAQREAREAVLENLLKAQELDDRTGNGGMEAKTALVWADGRVELAAIAAVHAHLAGVIHPGHAEAHHAIRLHQPLHNAVSLQLRMLLHVGLQGVKHFINRL